MGGREYRCYRLTEVKGKTQEPSALKASPIFSVLRWPHSPEREGATTGHTPIPEVRLVLGSYHSWLHSSILALLPRKEGKEGTHFPSSRRHNRELTRSDQKKAPFIVPHPRDAVLGKGGFRCQEAQLGEDTNPAEICHSWIHRSVNITYQCWEGKGSWHFDASASL